MTEADASPTPDRKAAPRVSWFGAALASPATGYSVVYHLEIALLFATLVALGPLVRRPAARAGRGAQAPQFGLAEFPG